MLKLEKVYFTYTPNGPYLLQDLNLTINDGDYISIVGENGSGKTTLIKLLLHSLSPNKGSIVSTFKRPVYVPQRFENLNTQFPITVYEILNCYRKTLKIKDKDCITHSLNQVDMYEYRHSRIGTLSGGQCQRIFIARALLGQPDVLFLDEPSNGVDVKSQSEIYRIIKRINRSNKVTVISVEHNLKAAIENSTRIYHVAQGRGHFCSPEEYRQEYLQANTRSDPYAAL
ncbi:MAG: metal transporter ATP-binding protein [Firmicutes bacterium]|nr:metal transporter ATP-binding protein [Bacillota bacterium]